MPSKTDDRSVEEIYNSIKELRRKEMEPYMGEVDFSKLKEIIQPLRVGTLSGSVPIIKLNDDTAEAGKFLRAKLIKDRVGQKTREFVEKYKEVLTIPFIATAYPFGDEIQTIIFFPSPTGEIIFRDMEKGNYVERKSGKYVITVPVGLSINLKTRHTTPPYMPMAIIDWQTGDLEKDFQLNRKYVSQFLKQ